MSIKKSIYITIGSISLVLGCIGIFIPILPTVPFFLITTYCYSRSSEKLHEWFIQTDMYKKHLQSYVEKKGMTIKTKIYIILMVSLLMGFGIFMMSKKQIWIPCIILGIVWLIHIIYFIFGVKTINE